MKNDLLYENLVTGFKVNTADKKVDILAFLPETSGSQSLQIINKDHQFLLQDIYFLPGNQVDTGKIFNIIHQVQECHAIHYMVRIGSLTNLRYNLAVNQLQPFRCLNLAVPGWKNIPTLINQF